jgi:hypothetical protein
MEEEEEEERTLLTGKNHDENSFASKTKAKNALPTKRSKQPRLKTRDGNGRRLLTLEEGLYG